MKIGFDDLFYTFFEFGSGKHNLMGTAKAFHSEIGACPHDFPLFASARMFFSKFDDVPETIFIGHGDTPLIIIVPIIAHLPGYTEKVAAASMNASKILRWAGFSCHISSGCHWTATIKLLPVPSIASVMPSDEPATIESPFPASFTA